MTKPPSTLSKAEQDLWREILRQFPVEDAHELKILETGLMAHDRAEQCRQKIDREGLTVLDRFGQSRPHPLLSCERDNRALFLSAVRQLGFDLEPLNARPGRPSGGKK